MYVKADHFVAYITPDEYISFGHKQRKNRYLINKEGSWSDSEMKVRKYLLCLKKKKKKEKGETKINRTTTTIMTKSIDVHKNHTQIWNYQIVIWSGLHGNSGQNWITEKRGKFCEMNVENERETRCECRGPRRARVRTSKRYSRWKTHRLHVSRNVERRSVCATPSTRRRRAYKTFLSRIIPVCSFPRCLSPFSFSSFLLSLCV